MKSGRLALPEHEDSLTEPVVFGGVLTGQRAVEPAGDIYEVYLCRRLGLIKDPEEKSPKGDDDGADDDEPVDDAGVNKEKLNEKRKKAKKEDAAKKTVFKNHYQALGLELKYMDSTLDDVRKAYKQRVLTHHPDKHDEGGYDEVAKQQFRQIQEAYETLVDPDKKRKYDSTMEFDESIPAAREYTEDEFFFEFAGVFARNSGFSEVKPVPQLGDMKTPIAKVLKFYEFWKGFKSWRDFTHEDEYDLEQAENRYERRYMDRENKRMKKELLKEEKNRINKLVNLARSQDPRVKKYEKEEAEKQARLLEEKRLEKQRKIDEKERAKAEALEQARVKAEQEAEEQRKKEEQIKAARNAKKAKLEDIKTYCVKRVGLPEYGAVFWDFFYSGLLESEVTTILDILKNEDSTQETLQTQVREFVSAVKERQSPQEKSKRTQKDFEREKKAAVINKWSEEEIALLTKGILKFPAGMGGRWEKIVDFIGGTKNIHDVTEMAKELSIKNVRGEKNVATVVEGALKAVKEPVKVADKPEAKTAAPNPLEWSQAQQKALESAMKTFPATMDKKERWVKIAEAVPGKTAKECVDRVKEIKEKMAQKSATPAQTTN